MTLTTHTLVGTAVALLFRANPPLAFVAAFASHFVLDALPHWDYKIPALGKKIDETADARSLFGSRGVWRDLFFVGLDLSLGIFLGFLLSSGFPNTSRPTAVALGALGGILPDALQVVYALCPRGILASLHRFHMRIENEELLRTAPVWGVFSQAVVIIVTFVLARLYINPF